MSLLMPSGGRLAPKLLPSLSCVAIFLMSSIGVPAQPTASSKVTWSPVSAPAEFGETKGQWIKIDGRDEYKHLAVVFRPAGAGPFPVVVVLHGGGGLRRTHIELAEQVSAAGFVVVAACWQHVESRPPRLPNPLCSEAPPQRDWLSDPANNSGKELIAVTRSLPGVRPDRAGLFGISRGGHAALWAASTGANVQVVVADAPAIFPAVTPPPPSPQHAVAGLTPPVLVLHGTADPVISVEQSREYKRTAQAFGKSITTVFYDGVGHQTTIPNRRETAELAERRKPMQPEARSRAIEFLRQHLQ